VEQQFPCARQHELLEKVQRHLLRLAELAHEEAGVIAKNDPRWKDLDKTIENELGEKERTLGALREHQHQHGCEPGVVRHAE